MKNKLFTLLLAIIAGTSALLAENGTLGTNANITWDLTNGVLTINGLGSMGDLSSSSNRPWWNIRSNIKSIVIGEGITEIGNYAFYGCSSVTSVTISNTVKHIGYRSFRDCDSLSTITIPIGVTHIYQQAFENCRLLNTVNMGNNVYYIGSFAFNNTPWNTQMYTKSGAVYVGKLLYCYNENNSNVTHLTINEGTIGIASYAFQQASISSISFPNSLIAIGQRAFYNCNNLTSLVIPANVHEAFCAFENCSGLTNVVWNATNCLDGDFIAGNAMYGISASSSSPFINCPNITSFTFGENIQHIPGYICALMANVDSITIPQSVTSIGISAFQQCTSLRNMTLPSSITKISDRTFYGCSSLQRINIPESVTTIGNRAFYQCTSMEGNIIIPNDLDTIYNYAFTGFTNIDSIVIGKNVKYIGDRAFDGIAKKVIFNAESCVVEYCSWLINTPLEGVVIGDGVKRIPNDFLSYHQQLTEVRLPSSVKTIGDLAFCGCCDLVNIVMPDSLTYIGSFAFSQCNKLSNVIIPNTVYYVGRGAFYKCKNISSIIIPSSVVTLGSDEHSLTSGIFSESGLKEVVIEASSVIPSFMFNSCDSLKKVTIGVDVRGIGPNPFYRCNNIDTIIYNAYYIPNLSQLSLHENTVKHIEFGDSVSYLPSNICYGMNSLKTVEIPRSVVGISSQAFDNCPNINSIKWNSEYCYDFDSEENSPFYTVRQKICSIEFGNEVKYIPAYLCNGMRLITETNIPEGVYNIGRSAFENCYGLSKIYLPSTLENIGEWAFMNTYDLVDITCLAITPPTTGNNVFSNVSGVLHVPCQARPSYVNHREWGKFASIDCVDNNIYTITFLNWDGSELQITEVAEGDMPRYFGSTPDRSDNNQYTYAFAGWTPELAAATEDAIYTATFSSTLREYMITFLDEDSTVLSAREWEYGTTPSCAEPTKADDEQYTYTFAGWTPEVVAVNGEATYTATYSKKDKHEGFENVSSESAPQKILINGTIYILRGDRVYTLQVQEVK